MSKAIANSHSFQSFQKSIILSLLIFDFISNGRGILSCIALSEDEKRQITSDAYNRKAAFRIVIEFVQGIVEISSNIIHIFTIRIWMIRVSITKSSTHRLVHKDDIVLLYPSIVVFYNLVGCHLSWLYEMRPQLHEVAKLTGRSGSSVKPDDCWEAFESILGCSLFSVENESKTRPSLSLDVEIATHYDSIVIIGRDREIDIVALGLKVDSLVVFLRLENSISLIFSFLCPIRGSVE